MKKGQVRALMALAVAVWLGVGGFAAVVAHRTNRLFLTSGELDAEMDRIRRHTDELARVKFGVLPDGRATIEYVRDDAGMLIPREVGP